MSYFAKVINGIVVNVNSAEQEWVDEQPDKDLWVQTSYNSRGGVHYKPNSWEPSGQPHLRYNYAGIGFTYDKERDAFIPPKPYPSWVLDENTCWWNPPVPYPVNEEILYEWDEELLNWKEVNHAT